jgi:uncharacterized protein
LLWKWALNMPRDYATLPYHEVKRRDRAVTDESWIREFLREGHWGALATVHDGQPCINTNLFVFDERKHVIFTHTARFGRTRANLESDQPVCFTVSQMGRILPAEAAVDFSVEYAQVTVFGHGGVVDDPDEARIALRMLLEKYAPHLSYDRDYSGMTASDLKRTSVFRIDITEWSGKRKVGETDFAGGCMIPRAWPEPVTGKCRTSRTT